MNDLLSHIAPWSIALAGTATGIVVGLWNQIKAWGARLISHVIVTEEVEESLGFIITSHLNIKLRRSPFGEHYWTEAVEFVRPEDRNRRVGFMNTAHAVQIYWKGRIPIWLARSPESNDGGGKSISSNGGKRRGKFTFSYFRGTFKWEAFIQDALDAEDSFKKQESYGHRYQITRRQGRARRKSSVVYNNGPEKMAEAGRPDSVGTSPAHSGTWNRFSDMIPVKWKPEDLGPRQSLNALSMLSINHELLDVIEEIRFWRDSEKWYTERGIPWRRGLIFYGLPGTGKTSLARALAEELDLPVIIMDLASMTGKELQDNWQYVRNQQPCLVLFEDIDNVFHGRENVADVEDGVTFDVLLNCIDGIERAEGTLVIFTVNDLTKVDGALYAPKKVIEGEEDAEAQIASRPGRVDRAVEFLPLDEDGRRKMALRIVTDATIAEDLVNRGKKDTAAQFQEKCFQTALRRLFQARKEAVQ